MVEGPHAARIASLIGDPARASMLYALMDGRALSVTELGAVAGIGKQAASGHLGKLVEARLLVPERQGRHRYHRLASDDVADLLERLMCVADRAGARPLVTGPRDDELRRARTCYDHLAGELAVACLDRLLERRWLSGRPTANGDRTTLSVTREGAHRLTELGLPVDELGAARRPLCRSCLDWSVRRPHLAGSLGAAMLDLCLRRRWAGRVEGSRAVRFSARGEAAFVSAFGG